jgi:hypothetical protein
METNSNEPQKTKGSPLLALLFGFAPAVVAMTLMSGAGRNLSGPEQIAMLWAVCAFSLACCVISSGLLFRRRTGAAIAGAVLLFLINGFIAFFFGCCASINL